MLQGNNLNFSKLKYPASIRDILVENDHFYHSDFTRLVLINSWLFIFSCFQYAKDNSLKANHNESRKKRKAIVKMTITM